MKIHGGGNFDTILTLWRLQVSLKFRGVNFDIILAFWGLQVNLKIHGGGNFDITLALWRLQVRLKFDMRANVDIILNLSKPSCAILVAQSDQRVAQSWELPNPEKFRNRTLFLYIIYYQYDRYVIYM